MVIDGRSTPNHEHPHSEVELPALEGTVLKNEGVFNVLLDQTIAELEDAVQVVVESDSYSFGADFAFGEPEVATADGVVVEWGEGAEISEHSDSFLLKLIERGRPDLLLELIEDSTVVMVELFT